MKNLYDLLEVSRDATPKDIRRAYRRAAKRHHPDAGGDAEVFAQISLAHEILMDPERRFKYDNTGDVTEATANNAVAELIQTLFGIFGSVMTSAEAQGIDPATVDLVDAMVDIVRQVMEGQDKEIDKLEKKRTLLNRVLGRFEPMDEEAPNHMETIVRENLRQLDMHLKPLKKNRELQRQAKVYIEGCQYHKEMTFQIGGLQIFGGPVGFSV